MVAWALTLAAGEVYAQKYPERKTTRQGTKLYNKGDFTGAETQYRRALELNPALREATFNLADALWRQEKPEDAAKLYESLAADSLAPVPMVSAASFNLGNTALVGQQIDAAIEAYKSALRLTPDDMQAKYNLAYAQAMKQQQNQQQDQNQNQDQDKNKDQDGDGQNDPQEGDQNQDQNQNGEGDQDQNPNDPKEDQGDPPPPSEQQDGQNPGQPKIDPATAQQMLDAMQAAEDDTREKVNAKEVRVGARSGKNW
jgi:tetratricopeptide (TPR) repeat protein